jgi:ankyrin repeat protein
MNVGDLFNPYGCMDSQIPFNMVNIQFWMQSNHPDSQFMPGSNPCSGFTPLMVVARSNRTPTSNAFDIAKMLINCGANVNHRGQYGNATPALGYAIWANTSHELKYKMMELLLSHGADPNYGVDPKFNFLAHLAMEDNHKCLILMLQYGANPNRLFNVSKPTPLIKYLEDDKLRENPNFMDTGVMPNI